MSFEVAAKGPCYSGDRHAGERSTSLRRRRVRVLFRGVPFSPCY